MSFRRRSEGLGRAKVACDACRHKKAKCDGLVPCTRCRDGRNDDICCYSRRIESSEQVFSALYVKMLRRQLHITLSSLRFLVERIALDKDCRAYVPELDTPINTVISLIQDSPEFDEEQGKEFSEMSDSELTMLSPQELPYPAAPQDANDDPPSAMAVKAEPAQLNSVNGVSKRKTSDDEHESGPEAKPRPRGRPKKVKYTASSDEPESPPLAVTSSGQSSYNAAASEVAGSNGVSTDSTPLTPVSVRSDVGDESPVRQAPIYPKMPVLEQGEHGSAENDAFPLPMKPPVFSAADYPTNPITQGTDMGVSYMDTMMDGEPLGPPLQLDRAGPSQMPSQMPEAGPRPWAYPTRLPYGASLMSDQMPEVDFFGFDECLPNWPGQASGPPVVVSMNDLEYQMPR